MSRHRPASIAKIACTILAGFLCCAAVGCAPSAPTESYTDAQGAAIAERVTAEPADAASASVAFSLPSGSYPQEMLVLQIAAPQGCTIRYTVDGSMPTAASEPYTGPLVLRNRTLQPSVLMSPENIEQMSAGAYTIRDSILFPKANVIRAAAVSPDGSLGPVATATYFVGVDLPALYPGMPVLSMATDPANLVDYDRGILVRGAVYDDWVSTPEAEEVLAERKWQDFQGNFSQKGSDWERPVSFELLVDGRPAVAFPAGIRIKGGLSRIFGQRAFNVYLRDKYGLAELEYPLIPSAVDADGDVIGSYTRFSLRAGGNDTLGLKFRDPFLQSLVVDRAFDTQASTPVVAFMNGEYLGVYSMHERYCADYFAARYGLDPDEVVLVKEAELDEGEPEDFALYEELMSFASRDLSDPAVWEEFARVVDVESLLDYCAAEVYIGNYDWREEKNTELWRTRGVDPANPYADGKWRFCLYDVDLSTGIYFNREEFRSDFDTLAHALEGQPLFAAALRNGGFRQSFVDRLDEMGRTVFEPRRVAERLAEFAPPWKRLVLESRLRYGVEGSSWETMLDDIEGFFAERRERIVAYAIADLAAFGGVEAPASSG